MSNDIQNPITSVCAVGLQVMDPSLFFTDPDLDPSMNKQKNEKTFISTVN